MSSRRTSMLSCAVLVCLQLCATGSALGAEPDAVPLSGPSPVEELAAASRAFSDAYERNDVETIKSLYTEDALLLPPGTEVRGRENAGEYFRWPAGRRQLAHAMKTSRLDVYGNVAIDVGTWHSTSQRGDREPVASSGTYLVVWHRGADGRWRIQYDMWHRPTNG